jgi:hypothetical protein
MGGMIPVNGAWRDLVEDGGNGGDVKMWTVKIPGLLLATKRGCGRKDSPAEWLGGQAVQLESPKASTVGKRLGRSHPTPLLRRS